MSSDPTADPVITISQRIVPSPSAAASSSPAAHSTLWSSLNPRTRLAHQPQQTGAEGLTRKIIFEPPWWITAWFAGSSVLVIWDFTYCFLRPHSFTHWIWQPYRLYATIDMVYSPKAFEDKYGFTNAQAFLNVVETILNFEYIYLAHTTSTSSRKARPEDARGHPTAPLIGFAAAVMTLSKTLLYWLIEWYSDFGGIGHNDPQTLFWLWMIPNGLWIVVPFFVMCTLGAAIASALRRDAGAAVHEMEAMRAAYGPVALDRGPGAANGLSLAGAHLEAEADTDDLRTPTKPALAAGAASGSLPASEVRQLRSRDVSMTPSRSARGESVLSSAAEEGEAGALRSRHTARRGRAARM